ncbi:hypothetical protein VIBNISOn1_1530010 [Vibrio nigripulchritudo SOn1]|uniref:Uncharacterized protein n=1 Tax=Vibrio nigripulchritudo SOn1 TaxID=1238450 RepID=A0AAV2VM40_9VIBR|nr:hypothetical protein VIBNISOn1_1530010 [Vibrio nigripulchritudo SOn1]
MKCSREHDFMNKNHDNFISTDKTNASFANTPLKKVREVKDNNTESRIRT